MTKINTQLVHENDVQRRHARIRIPLKIFITADDGEPKSFSLLDISVSGFSVNVPPDTLCKDCLYKGELQFNLNNERFLMPVMFTVLYYNHEEKKAGCAFDQLEKEGLSILQLFISKYLCGELVTNEDILSTLSRDNFTKGRSKKEKQGLKGWRKARTVAGTVLAACLGILALTFIVTNIYNHLFITHDIIAMVDISTKTINSPVSGNFRILDSDNRKIRAGQPIAGIFSPVTGYIKDVDKHLANGQSMESLLPKELHSVVNSPFNGTIIANQAKDKSFVRKGDPLFTVIREGNEPYIRAVFNYTDVDTLPVGKKVTLQFPGMPESFTGVITDINVDIQKSSHTFFASIKPDIVLPYDTLQRPVHVLVSPAANSSSLISATSHFTSVLAKAQ